MFRFLNLRRQRPRVHAENQRVVLVSLFLSQITGCPQHFQITVNGNQRKGDAQAGKHGFKVKQRQRFVYSDALPDFILNAFGNVLALPVNPRMTKARVFDKLILRVLDAPASLKINKLLAQVTAFCQRQDIS